MLCMGKIAQVISLPERLVIDKGIEEERKDDVCMVLKYIIFKQFLQLLSILKYLSLINNETLTMMITIFNFPSSRKWIVI